jgi:hypothetical protein
VETGLAPGGTLGAGGVELLHAFLRFWTALLDIALLSSAFIHRWNSRKIFNSPPESTSADSTSRITLNLPAQGI